MNEKKVGINESGIYSDTITAEVTRLFPEGHDLSYDIICMFIKNNLTVQEAERILESVKEQIPTCARIITDGYTR